MEDRSKEAFGWASTLVLALVGALIAIPRMDIGFSTLDDGFYAYAADALLRGEIIHKDFFSQYLGYQHVIHAGLFLIFGEDYLVLRYFLVFLTFISLVSAIRLFGPQGRPFQLAAVFVTTGFGFLLFNNPSTSWTCVTLTMLIMWTSNWRRNDDAHLVRLVLIGVILGTMLGFRHPTAIFVGMGVLVSEFLSCENKSEIDSPRWHKICAAASILLVAVALIAYMGRASHFLDLLLWFIAPLSYTGYCLGMLGTIDCGKFLKRIFFIAFGFGISLIPLVGYSMIMGNIAETWRDLATMPVDYSSMLDVNTFGIGGDMMFVLNEVGGPRVWVSVLIVSIVLLYPLLVSDFIWRRSPGVAGVWIKSPITVISVYHGLVIVALISQMYLSYIMAFVYLSLLYAVSLVGRKSLSVWAVMLSLGAGTFAFLVMGAQLGVNGRLAFLGAPQDRQLVKCWMPKCSVRVGHGYNELSTAAYDAVAKTKRPYSTVTVLPWGYHYDFSYEPWQRSPYPDIRVPLYQGVPAADAYVKLMADRDPVIVVVKPSMRDESVYREFADYFARDFSKTYDSPVIMVLVKKNRH